MKDDVNKLLLKKTTEKVSIMIRVEISSLYTVQEYSQFSISAYVWNLKLFWSE